MLVTCVLAKDSVYVLAKLLLDLSNVDFLRGHSDILHQ